MPASRSLSRCLVTLQTRGAGAEELFTHRIDAALERLEVLFDELEQAGRRFQNPRSSSFKQPQAAVDRQGDETCLVEVVCTPPMTVDELRSLATRVASLLSELPDVTPREVRAVERAASDADTDPGVPPERPDDAATREHVASSGRSGVRQEVSASLAARSAARTSRGVTSGTQRAVRRRASPASAARPRSSAECTPPPRGRSRRLFIHRGLRLLEAGRARVLEAATGLLQLVEEHLEALEGGVDAVGAELLRPGASRLKGERDSG